MVLLPARLEFRFGDAVRLRCSVSRRGEGRHPVTEEDLDHLDERRLEVIDVRVLERERLAAERAHERALGERLDLERLHLLGNGNARGGAEILKRTDLAIDAFLPTD